MPLPTQSLAADVRSLDALRTKAASDPRGAVREAAKAFETLFMQEVLKSMRAATLRSGLMDGDSGGQLGTEMLDQQLATRMSGLPGGAADVLARQLERQLGLALPQPAGPAASPVTGESRAPVQPPQKAAASFVQQHTEAARRVEQHSGIPAGFMIGQAALESGWGRREILNADGSTSHNLFGIKAGPGWKGPVAEITTTEYIGGRPQKVTARFRAYASYDESFADFARLMKDNPRYAGVIANGGTVAGFAQNLQKAGYATDPAYAEKLTRVINTALRLQRSLA